jgi:hypothetical protein
MCESTTSKLASANLIQNKAMVYVFDNSSQRLRSREIENVENNNEGTTKSGQLTAFILQVWYNVLQAFE